MAECWEAAAKPFAQAAAATRQAAAVDSPMAVAVRTRQAAAAETRRAAAAAASPYASGSMCRHWLRVRTAHGYFLMHDTLSAVTEPSWDMSSTLLTIRRASTRSGVTLYQRPCNILLHYAP